MKFPKNIAASIRQRLLNYSKNAKKPFNEVLQYYAMERFLYRLSQSQYANQFILKGGLMLRIWDASESRPTMDIDMLGITSNETSNITQQIKNILAIDVISDGLTFDASSIKTDQIIEDADYQGVRVSFKSALDNAMIHMQLDIGFGDIVYPSPEKALMPTILDLPAPELLTYSRETLIAEKFEAMIKHGSLNSRMKDFYDIWMLSRRFNFNGEQLGSAIRLTFTQRSTALSIEVEAFKDQFINTKQVQWTAFLKRLKQAHVPNQFKEIVTGVEDFLSPLVYALSKKSPMPNNWDTRSWLQRNKEMELSACTQDTTMPEEEDATQNQ